MPLSYIPYKGMQKFSNDIHCSYLKATADTLCLNNFPKDNNHRGHNNITVY